jgi:hypothetical protein
LGRIIAALIRLVGDFELAEEAAQEAFAAAVGQWRTEGVPSTPAFANSSLKLPISVSSFWSGITSASLFLSALIKITEHPQNFFMRKDPPGVEILDALQDLAQLPVSDFALLVLHGHFIKYGQCFTR